MESDKDFTRVGVAIAGWNDGSTCVVNVKGRMENLTSSLTFYFLYKNSVK